MANVNYGVNIIPITDNAYTLGNSSYKWQLYTSTINGVSVSTVLLPTVTSSNNGQFLTVTNGAWVAGNIPSMIGATSSVAGSAGLVPAPSTSDTTKFLRGDGTWQDGGKPMVILSYGNSTWSQFIDAYQNNIIVYCRASSNTNPASGSQTRMAFMAYVNNETSPTEVEFQYYRSVSSKSATQLGDQVYVYKLTSNNSWTVTVREASVKEIVAGQGISVSYNSNKVTINSNLPAVSASDNGKILKVVDGAWALVEP